MKSTSINQLYNSWIAPDLIRRKCHLMTEKQKQETDPRHPRMVRFHRIEDSSQDTAFWTKFALQLPPEKYKERFWRLQNKNNFHPTNYREALPPGGSLRIPDVSAKDVSAKTWRRTFRQKNMPKHLRLKICRNVSHDICDVCTLALTVAKTSSHYDRFAIFVPARSLLLFDLAQQDGNISGPKGPRGTTGNGHISEKGTGRFGKNIAADVSAKKICRNVSNFFCRNVLFPSLKWCTWKTLNRLRCLKGRSKDTLKKWGVITDNKCACGEVQTMEHIVRSSGLTMDQLFEATPEAVQLAEKWQATLWFRLVALGWTRRWWWVDQ